MSNTTKLPQPIFDLVQTLLDVRSQMEDVEMEAKSLISQYGDASEIYGCAKDILYQINCTLDDIKYNEA